MPKKKPLNGTIAGAKGFSGKKEYLTHLKEKLAAGNISPRTIARQRGVIRQVVALKRLNVEDQVKRLDSQSLAKLVSVLPTRVKNKDVLDMSQIPNTDICLRGLSRLDKFMKRGFLPNSKQAKQVIPILEKMLISNLSMQVKKKALNMIFEYNLGACVPFLEWISTKSDRCPERIRARARVLAKKMQKSGN